MAWVTLFRSNSQQTLMEQTLRTPPLTAWVGFGRNRIPIAEHHFRQMEQPRIIMTHLVVLASLSRPMALCRREVGAPRRSPQTPFSPHIRATPLQLLIKQESLA